MPETAHETITGRTLLDWGFETGPALGDALKAARAAYAQTGAIDDARRAAEALRPPRRIPLSPEGATPVTESVIATTVDEVDNVDKARESARLLARTPTVEAVALLPDVCPAGPAGVIPVGAVAAARGAIHPGMHSADICCSVAVTTLGRADPGRVLDAAAKVTHFGAGGRGDAVARPPAALLAAFEDNPFLAGMTDVACDHFATQGDGNHFLYVGRFRSTGETALVTHHGSRKPGAILYARGMKAAEARRRRISPESPKPCAWLDVETAEGEAYWAALHLIRDWTKRNHFAIHDMTVEAAGLRAQDRFWNEHNFVFRRGDLFLHAKGATPAWRDCAPDSAGLTLVPLNMAAPVLVTEGADNPRALGFSPHGAGRNLSRTAFLRRNAERGRDAMLAEETAGLDVRFHCGFADLSELPSAYKSAEKIEDEIERFGLARVVDHIDPFGAIMAGDQRAAFRDRRARGRRG